MAVKSICRLHIPQSRLPCRWEDRRRGSKWGQTDFRVLVASAGFVLSKLGILVAANSRLPVTAQVPFTTTQIAKKVSPSVVVIEGNTDSGKILGSGFIVSKDGKIVTNFHVIRDMKSATIELANGEIFDSPYVLATDERKDLAIIQIAGFDLPVLEMGQL